MTTLREDFDAASSRWREKLLDDVGQLDLAEAFKILVIHWQQWEADASAQHDLHSATPYGSQQPEAQAHCWQLVVEQRVTTDAGNFKLDAWRHQYERHV